MQPKHKEIKACNVIEAFKGLSINLLRTLLFVTNINAITMARNALCNIPQP